MFGNILHPTLELCLVLIVVSTMFVAESSIIVKGGHDDDCSSCKVVDKNSMNYVFSVMVLVVSVLTLVYGLGFLGLYMYDKYA